MDLRMQGMKTSSVSEVCSQKLSGEHNVQESYGCRAEDTKMLSLTLSQQCLKAVVT